MPRKSPPAKLENLSFGPLLRHFLQTIRAAIEDSLHPAGFSLRQAMVLSALNRNPGMTGAEMAQSMLITPQAMGELLQEMEKAGLVRRQARRDNARKRAIFLTPSGRKALSTCCTALHLVEDRMLASLNTSERKRLSRLLVLCIEGLSK
jgi:DNA-binding MarR family transcriptional regulator